MSETRNLFARNLSRLVEESGIEQQKLAFDLNVSPSIVSSWVLGKRFPRANTMQQLADYFHVSISELIDDRTELNQESPQLRILFSRSKKLNETQLDIVNRIVAEMVKEQNGFSE